MDTTLLEGFAYWCLLGFVSWVLIESVFQNQYKIKWTKEFVKNCFTKPKLFLQFCLGMIFFPLILCYGGYLIYLKYFKYDRYFHQRVLLILSGVYQSTIEGEFCEEIEVGCECKEDDCNCCDDSKD